jgi:DNA-binding transcriptional LysR family regulator
MKDFDDLPSASDLRSILAVLDSGTVTRAAQRLGLSQSALSYQIERMRRRFGDPLFVRSGNRMAPTPLAQRLADPASRILRILETEVAGLQRFQPAATTREFRIGVNEIGAITLVPRIVRQLAAAAPHARLAPVQVDSGTLGGALESGAMDVAAGHFPQAHAGLKQQLLYRRDYVCIARRDHPRIGASMTLRELSRTPQVHTPAVVATRAWMEEQLRKEQLPGGVAMSTHHVAAIPFIVAASDHVALIPREVFELFAPIAPVKAVRLPVTVPALSIHLYWHPRVDVDPAVSFFREIVRRAAVETRTSPKMPTAAGRTAPPS